jgi:hypothetical protein
MVTTVGSTGVAGASSAATDRQSAEELEASMTVCSVAQAASDAYQQSEGVGIRACPDGASAH